MVLSAIGRKYWCRWHEYRIIQTAKYENHLVDNGAAEDLELPLENTLLISRVL